MSELALPEGWLKKELSVLTQVITKGTTPTTLGYTYQHSGVNFLKVENIGDNKIDLKSINQYISDEANDALKRSQLVESDILFSIAGTIGKTALVSKEHLPMNTNQAIAIIRGSDSSLVPDFLKYQLQNFIEIIKLKSRGGAMNNVSLKDLKEFEVTVPAIAEQKEVVRFLDTHLTTVSQIQARLDAIPKIIENFRQSVIRDAVNGELIGYKHELDKVETISLEDVIASSMNGLSKRSGDTGEKEIVLRLADFKDAKRTYGGERKIRITSEELEKYRIGTGDILIVRVNGSADLAGKFILYKEEEQPEAFCDHFIKIKLDLDKARPEFVVLIANEGEGRHYLRNSLSTSAGQNTINQKSVKGLEFRLPPLEIQDNIIQTVKKFFDHANQIEKSVATAKARVDHLTQSILHQAFTGNLTKEWREQNPELISGDNSAEALLAKIEAEKQGSSKKNLVRDR